ncbi:MAG: DUF2914 domain-containing protein [Acidobacteria bacterium]|nr:MAG: DUF2914 domain-containing protein [Acidobacteriota bacterium]
MATVGETLKACRERRGLGLERVASETRIRREFLEALEEGRLEDLPGSTYVRGFIRTYASLLDLDPAPLLEQYAREEEQAIAAGRITPPPDLVEDLRTRIAERGRAGLSRRRAIGALTAALVLVACAALAWLALTRPWTLRAPGTRAASRPADAVAPAPPTPSASPRAGRKPPAGDAGAGTRRPDVAPATGRREPAAEPEPEPEAAPPRTAAGTGAAEPVAPPGQGLRVADSGVGRAVVNRTLADRTERFAEGETVWFWTRVVGGRKGDSIRHVWLHDGRLVGVATLPVGGPHWRTWSRRTLEPPATGRWTVRAVAPDGRILAEHVFVCE